MAASTGQLPYKAPCSAEAAALGHRMLGRQRPAGARAEGAGPAGRGRGARRGGHCARRRCSFGSRSAPGAPGRGRARAGARGIPGHGRRSPRAPPARTCQARRGPRTSGRGRPRLPSPSRPEAPGAGLHSGGRVGGRGRGRGRRLGAGVAGASREGWWPEWRVPVSAGPWVAGLGPGAWGGASVGAVAGGGPGGDGVGVHGAFWKAADRG